MSTAEELLCSRKWRLTHSLWMILGWVPMGLTAWIGYLIIGIRAKNWKWILISAGLFAWVIVLFAWSSTFPSVKKGTALPDEYAASSGWWALCIMIVWLGNAIGLQWWINRKWLVARAHRGQSSAWYATSTAARRSFSTPQDPRAVTTLDQALRSQQPFVPTAAYAPPHSAHGQQPLRGPYPPPVLPPTPNLPPATLARLDLNTATREQLATLPGFDPLTVDQVIAARQRLGGFKDPSDLVSFGALRPHLFAAIQSRVVVESHPHQTSNGAPATDPNATRGGRRLDF